MKIKPECVKEVQKCQDTMRGCHTAIASLTEKMGHAEGDMWRLLAMEHDLEPGKNYTVEYNKLEIIEK